MSKSRERQLREALEKIRDKHHLHGCDGMCQGACWVVMAREALQE